MSGLKFEELSSNWKKLQGKLQAEKKESAQNHGVKRKRTEERNKIANRFKKPRVAEHGIQGANKKYKMGSNVSRPQEPATNGVQHATTLANKLGITPDHVSSAYGTRTPLQRNHVDHINGGLHSTHKAGRYVSLDCEMVGTGTPPHYTDNILARVSLVNFHGEQLYDSYVLPPLGTEIEDIKDYRTFVSGITPEHIQPEVARPFKDVQRDVADLLDGRVLVGHALRNDLTVLMLSHPKRDLRDTSRHPPFRVASGGRPPALRVLARKELGWEIQGGEHSSLEDARAAMGLFRKEKLGFDEEVRKRFGTHTVLTKKTVKTKGEAAGRRKGEGDKDGDQDEDGDEDDSDDRDELELLEGEEDDLDIDREELPANTKGSIPKAKKKTKKKKRTKRK